MKIKLLMLLILVTSIILLESVSSSSSSSPQRGDIESTHDEIDIDETSNFIDDLPLDNNIQELQNIQNTQAVTEESSNPPVLLSNENNITTSPTMNVKREDSSQGEEGEDQDSRKIDGTKIGKPLTRKLVTVKWRQNDVYDLPILQYSLQTNSVFLPAEGTKRIFLFEGELFLLEVKWPRNRQDEEEMRFS